MLIFKWFVIVLAALIVGAASQVVQVRSSSRLGKKDFGVNRSRIEAIRAQM